MKQFEKTLLFCVFILIFLHFFTFFFVLFIVSPSHRICGAVRTQFTAILNKHIPRTYCESIRVENEPLFDVKSWRCEKKRVFKPMTSSSRLHKESRSARFLKNDTRFHRSHWVRFENIFIGWGGEQRRKKTMKSNNPWYMKGKHSSKCSLEKHHQAIRNVNNKPTRTPPKHFNQSREFSSRMYFKTSSYRALFEAYFRLPKVRSIGDVQIIHNLGDIWLLDWWLPIGSIGSDVIRRRNLPLVCASDTFNRLH